MTSSILKAAQQAAQEANVEAQDENDSLGRRLLETGAHAFEFDVVYFTKADSGAVAYNCILKMEDDSTHRHTVYFTNAEGNPFYEKDGENLPLPGYNSLNALCELYLGKKFSELAGSDVKTITLDLWDSEQKKEMPTEVEAIVALTGKKGIVGVQKVRQNKQQKNPNPTSKKDKYIDTNEEQVVNEFDKFFDAKGFTLKEKKAEATEPKFKADWETKFGNEMVDKYKEVSSSPKTGGRAGAFRKPATKPDTASSDAAADDDLEDMFN